MSWYRKYQGQSVGRVLHFLEHYCGLHVAEHATIGPDFVSMYGERIATYAFAGDVPVFYFVNDDSRNRRQVECLADAIADGKADDCFTPPEGRL